MQWRVILSLFLTLHFFKCNLAVSAETAGQSKEVIGGKYGQFFSDFYLDSLQCQSATVGFDII